MRLLGSMLGRQRGSQVVGLTTTHSLAPLQEAGPDWTVEDLRVYRCTAYVPASMYSVDLKHGMHIDHT